MSAGSAAWAARLEVVRTVREQCYGMVGQAETGGSRYGDEPLYQAMLEIPVEVMAGWVLLSAPVMSSFREIVRRTEQTAGLTHRVDPGR
jgi:hypothetical protein